MRSPAVPVTVAFVLASYRPDEPAGMERAVAAMASGLRQLGHQAVIITAAPQPGPDPGVITLTRLPVAFPCDDGTLRDAIRSAGPALAREIEAALREHHADVVVYVDALWGLGILAGEVRHPARRVLAVHVVGHDDDLRTALAAAHQVIAPSESVLSEARDRGYRVDDLAGGAQPAADRSRRHAPRAGTAGAASPARPGQGRRQARRGEGRHRAAGSRAPGARQADGSSARRRRVRGGTGKPGRPARRVPGAGRRPRGTVLLPALAWREVPGFLAGAAVTVVPSARETFGNLALESLSVGTPVIAHATGNLPALIGPDAGILVPPDAGPAGLREAARDLLADPVRYHLACGAAYCRSRNYRSAEVASAFLKAVL